MPDGLGATDVLVLGAGVSGLTAGVCLAQAGCTVRWLEARERIGGRVHSLRGPEWPVPVDLGAEFIQGHIPELLDLAKSASLPVVQLGGTFWESRDGRLVRAKQTRVRGVISRLPELGPGEDQTLDQVLAKLHLEQAEVEDKVRQWVQSYDAADTSRVSVRFLTRERKAEERIRGDDIFRLVTGYDGIPRAVFAQTPAGRATLHLDTIATEVRWERDLVEVAARSSSGFARGPYTARRLVVALPLGVLQAVPTEPGYVCFKPSLDDKQEAVRWLEMGHVVKLLIAFKERWWQRFFEDELGFLRAEDDWQPGWWTDYPLYAPILVGWAGGPPADGLMGLTPEQRVDRALQSLARVLHIPRSFIENQVVTWATHDWAADPFARGAYSYVRAGGIEAQAQLARPVEQTLFFAGEATELTGHQATVHGALYAGRRAAHEVVRSLDAV